MKASDFRAIRGYLGISQAALGEQINRSKVQVSLYETDKAEIPREIELAMYWLEHEAQLKAEA